ncbi:TatD family hydrolase, partial [Planctomycetota bacterium]
MELVDIGVNLTNKRFRNDLDAVLKRAREASVTKMVVTGTSLDGSLAAAQLASSHAGLLWSTAGVHPHHAKECDGDSIARLRDLAARPEVVAIGECGLDFNRNFSPPETQRRWFEAQVATTWVLGPGRYCQERWMRSQAAFLTFRVWPGGYPRCAETWDAAPIFAALSG